MKNCILYDFCQNHNQCNNCIDFDKYLSKGDLEDEKRNKKSKK
jgi:hypothetical protein